MTTKEINKLRNIIKSEENKDISPKIWKYKDMIQKLLWSDKCFQTRPLFRRLNREDNFTIWKVYLLFWDTKRAIRYLSKVKVGEKWFDKIPSIYRDLFSDSLLRSESENSYSIVSEFIERSNPQDIQALIDNEFFQDLKVVQDSQNILIRLYSSLNAWELLELIGFIFYIRFLLIGNLRVVEDIIKCKQEMMPFFQDFFIPLTEFFVHHALSWNAWKGFSRESILLFINKKFSWKISESQEKIRQIEIASQKSKKDEKQKINEIQKLKEALNQIQDKE